MMPDPIALVVAHLRGESVVPFADVQAAIADLHTLVPPERIRAELKDAELMPRSYVTVRPGGGTGSEQDVPLFDARVDVRCYHRTGYEAARLERAVRAVLMPTDRTHGGWWANDGRVLSTSSAGAPLEFMDADGDWPGRIATYAFRIVEAPVTL